MCSFGSCWDPAFPSHYGLPQVAATRRQQTKRAAKRPGEANKSNKLKATEAGELRKLTDIDSLETRRASEGSARSPFTPGHWATFLGAACHLSSVPSSTSASGQCHCCDIRRWNVLEDTCSRVIASAQWNSS